MSVDVEGNGRVSVPQAPRDRLRVEARRDQRRSMGVAQGVEHVFLGSTSVPASAAARSRVISRCASARVPRTVTKRVSQGEGLGPLYPAAFGEATTAAGHQRAKVGGVMRYEGVALTATAVRPPPALRVAVDNGPRRALGETATVGRGVH